MASSPDKVKEATANLQPASPAPVASDCSAKKTVKVRMSQSQIDLFMSPDPPPLNPVKGVGKEMENRFAEIDAQLKILEDEVRADKAMVRKQYELKGYVECEADADLFLARAPRPGRRRARHGVVVKKKPAAN
uniref:Uncharacterized protein n=1 Tax=Leersia perrieri TaxID=77586 RepID=A0A0D9V4B0_9ORYZ